MASSSADDQSWIRRRSGVQVDLNSEVYYDSNSKLEQDGHMGRTTHRKSKPLEPRFFEKNLG